jgi:NAD(P) transhydrogenase subunit alpha
MSNISGYRAVVEASSYFGRFLGGQITAAGKITPAKVLIIGAGVAGLSAIGAAGNMGAIVRAFDTRGDARDQVESMDAEFLEVKINEDGNSDDGYAHTMSKEFIEAEMALFLQQAKEVDIIITTALIPGKPAPKLITKEMVQAMKNGSVIVDLASEQGGNCELTVKGEVTKQYGVHIVGFYDLPARLPEQSSQLYGSNIHHLFEDLTPKKDGNININFDDEVIRGATVVKQGEITFPAPPIKVSNAVKKVIKEEVVKKEESRIDFGFIAIILVSAITLYIGSVAPSEFLSHFIVFVLSCFVGYQVIWNITPALHTPLMSVTNAISGIIVLGGLVQMSSDNSISIIVASVAIFIATINIVGGFAVTNKTLKMFQK